MPMTRAFRTWLAFQASWLLAATAMLVLGLSWWLPAAVVVGAIGICPTPTRMASLADGSQRYVSRPKAILIGTIILLLGLAVALGLLAAYQHWARSIPPLG